MICNVAGTLLAGYADGEIRELRGRSIEQHLRSCADCAAQHSDILALRARIRAEVPYFQAPEALRARVRTLLPQSHARPPVASRPAPDRWRWLTGGALAGCAATVLAWVIGTALIDWRANEDVAVEAVATHVRATLNHHLIEVASSDQHTVKPWLSARLDYSPPVTDLADQGFALVGGRLDTLDGRRVATLVYRYRLHNVDVFVRPESAHAPSLLRTVRGFNVVHATGSGMDWLAVSDASAEVLTAFIQRLARGGS